MTKLKSLLNRAWNWLLGKTTIDERVSEVVTETKRRAKAVKQEVNELTSTIEEVFEQAKDISEAAKGGIIIEGKATKSKIREFKKAELIKHVKANFNVVLDDNLTKTNIVNKVYELHNGVKTSGRVSAGSPKKKSTKKSTTKTSGRVSAGSPSKK